MTSPDITIVSLGTRNYTTLTIDAPTLSHALRGLAQWLEGPQGQHVQFDSLTHTANDTRSVLLVDLSSRHHRLHD